MAFNEWQAKVLIVLWDLHDKKILDKDVAFTIPEIVSKILEVGSIGGEVTIRRFLYGLKDAGVLVKNGKQVRNYKALDGYTFDAKRAFYFLKDSFEDSVLGDLLETRIYYLMIHKKIK